MLVSKGATFLDQSTVIQALDAPPARKGNAPHGAEPSSVRLIDEKGLFLEYPPRNLLGGYVQITQRYLSYMMI